MSNYSAGRGPRPADPHPRLRLAALTAVIVGVVLLTAAAFVLSYAGIHQIALRAGVAPELAKLYPVIFDAMLVVAAAAVLALRGAGGWARAYAWSTLLLSLVVVAVGDALHTTDVTLPAQPTRAAVAVTPWVLLLLAFGLWLTMLRHFRRMRAAGAQQGPAPGQPTMTGDAATGQGATDQRANGVTGNGLTGNGDSGTGQRTAVTWAIAGGAGQGRPVPPPLSGLDALLGPKEGSTAAISGAMHDGGKAEHPGQTEQLGQAGYLRQAGYPDAGQYPDPVSYGEETGYVHPDSYLGPGDHSAGSLGVALIDAEPGKQPVPEPGPSVAQSGSAASAGPRTTGPSAAETAEVPQATGAAPTGNTPPAARATPADSTSPATGTAPAGNTSPATAAAPTGDQSPADGATPTGDAPRAASTPPAGAPPAPGPLPADTPPDAGARQTADADPAAAQPPSAGTATPAAKASSATEEPQPTAENTPKAAAKAAKATEQASSGQASPGTGRDAGSGGGIPETATLDANPRLERLRSTPARPNE
jgi:hypothetical protein